MSDSSGVIYRTLLFEPSVFTRDPYENVSKISTALTSLSYLLTTDTLRNTSSGITEWCISTLVPPVEQIATMQVRDSSPNRQTIMISFRPDNFSHIDLIVASLVPLLGQSQTLDIVGNWREILEKQ